MVDDGGSISMATNFGTAHCKFIPTIGAPDLLVNLATILLFSGEAESGFEHSNSRRRPSLSSTGTIGTSELTVVPIKLLFGTIGEKDTAGAWTIEGTEVAKGSCCWPPKMSMLVEDVADVDGASGCAYMSKGLETAEDEWAGY